MKLNLTAGTLLLSLWTASLSSAHAQGTAFTYQGRLSDGVTPANGTYDFRFRLAADPLANTYIGTPYFSSGVAVTNGLFTAIPDFGPGVLTGSNYWLEVDVRTNGSGTYSPLTPLQQLTPAPYAVFATSSSNLLGTLPAGQLNGAIANGNLPANPLFSGTVTANTFAGDGLNVSNVNALTLNGLSSGNFWQLGGNNVGGGQFLGSTNNQPIEIWANRTRVLRLEPGAVGKGAPNIIAGSTGNYISNSVFGATIAGGGITNGLGGTNQVLANFGTVGGGIGNSVTASSFDSTVAGGADNVAGGTNLPGFTVASSVSGGSGNSALAAYASIGGGALNTNASFASVLAGGAENQILGGAEFMTIGGGFQNTITNSGTGYPVIAGGFNNRITNADASVVSGGEGGSITAGADHSTIGGGYYNLINAQDSVIAGGELNVINIGANGSFIGGGFFNTNNGSLAAIGGGTFNTVSGAEGTIAGGEGHTIGASADHAFIGGGYQNQISGYESTIAGGFRNQINAQDAAIAGGDLSMINSGANQSFIGGGLSNTNNSVLAAIGGGQNNTVGGTAATIPGGLKNLANGNYSLAAGQQAQALHQGAFVWADSQNAAFASTASDQFNVRAQGGVRFVTSGAGVTVDGSLIPNSSIYSGITIQQNSSGAPNVIEGSPYNFVLNGAVGATIGGGGATNYLGSRYTNSVTGNFGTVGGGVANTVTGLEGTVGGGFGNIAGGGYSTVAGGAGNTAALAGAAIGGGELNTNNGPVSFVGSGEQNFIASVADHATIGGGSHNQMNGAQSTIGGGYFNTVNSRTAVIAGGNMNLINSNADISFIGGGSLNTNSGPWATLGGGLRNLIGTNASYSTIDGGTYNLIASNVLSGTIGGGSNNIVRGTTSTVGGGLANSADAPFTTVAGGINNHSANNDAVVAGGENNSASGYDSTVGGGGNNSAIGVNSTVAGGSGNTASGFAATVGGGGTDGIGQGNTASAASATVAGGSSNQATNDLATVPGGFANIAGGVYSFAAGQQAQAFHQGAFVWADSQNATFSSTASDQFLIRAKGGVSIDTSPLEGSLTLGTNTYLKDHAIYLRGNSGSDHNHGLAYNGQTTTNFGTGNVQVDGPVLWGFTGGALGVANGGAHAVLNWSNGVVAVTGNVYANGVQLTSDRNTKEHFTPVNAETVLAKVTALPVSEWNYKSESPDTRHVGPMAQDFHAAFGLNGADDKHISAIDETGVALAAIQGLNQEMTELKTENTELKQRLAALEKLVTNRK